MYNNIFIAENYDFKAENKLYFSNVRYQLISSKNRIAKYYRIEVANDMLKTEILPVSMEKSVCALEFARIICETKA